MAVVFMANSRRSESTPRRIPSESKSGSIPILPTATSFHAASCSTQVPRADDSRWTKAVKVWSNTHAHIPETMRLNLILESLKVNEERKEVGRWIVSTVDEGEFNTENPGALDEFLEKFKKKFEVSCWRKREGIWEQVLRT